MTMKLNDYQKSAAVTAQYPERYKITYPAFGMLSEAGEVAGKLKKIMRDKDGKFGKSEKVELLKELGDVLWYVAILARDLDCTLEEVAVMNINKLSARQEKGTIKGSGDDR